jgi:hypothetical protein
MSWPAFLVVEILSAVLGIVCAGLIGSLCVKWYRVSKFEGGAGCMVVVVALLGGVVGLAVGVFAMRIFAVGSSGFFPALGVASGAVLTVSLVARVICRRCADLAPTVDGRPLELAIEVRCPKNFTVPPPDEYGATAEVYLPRGRRLPGASLRVAEATTVDGQIVVPATVPLTTSAREKFLHVRFSREHSRLFPLRLPGRLSSQDGEWSGWVECGWDAGRPEPAKNEKFSVRWRVMKVPSPPPPPDLNDVTARKFAALTPASPLEEWLPFLFENPNDERTRAVLRAISGRQTELATLFRSDDDMTRERALAAAKYPEQPVPELIEAVLAEGRDIAGGIRRFNAMKDDAPDYGDVQIRLRGRFNDWKQAWWVLHQRAGLDGREPVREIHGLALVRAGGTSMNEIAVNARVILDALEKPSAEKTP